MKDLLAQIWANPEDDAPRLVYADYLAERGDPRGELIHLQLGPRTNATREREQALLREHQAAWAAGLGISVHFDRGFPHTIITTAPELLAAKHVIMTEPIREVVLVGDLKPHARALAAAPEMARLHRLALSNTDHNDGWRLRDPAFAELCAADLSNLRELEIGNHDLTVASARVLATTPWVSGLTKLAIRGNPLVDVQLLASKLSVTHLDLHHCGLEDPSGYAVSKISTLVELRLSYDTVNHDVNRFNRRIGEIAAQGLAKLDKLRRLDLMGAALGDEGAAALAEGTFAHLAWLSLARNGIRDAGAAAIANSFGALTELKLDDNAIGEPGAVALANSSALRSLIELNLESNLLGVPGITALANGTGLPALRRLAVGWNKLYTGEVIPRDDYDELVEETHAHVRARFAHKPHWYIA